MKNLILGLSILAIVYTGILYCCGNDSSLSFPYHITYNGQLSINNHSFIVYGNVTRNNDSSYFMNSTVLSKDNLSYIPFSLSWSSTGTLLTVSSYIVPAISYTSKRIEELVNIISNTWIILPLQNWWRLSGLNYDIIEDYGVYKRGLFTWLLSQSQSDYAITKIPYKGTYNLYCIPSMFVYFLQNSCNITVKINIDFDEQPIIIISIIDFVVSPVR